MKFLGVQLFFATFIGLCLSIEDTWGKDMDVLLQKLEGDNLEGGYGPSKLHILRYIEKTIPLRDGTMFQNFKTQRIRLEGIENMKRTSPAIGYPCRCPIQTVERVQFTVPRGINMTTTLEFEERREIYTGRLFMRWKNPSEDAIFNLKSLSIGDYNYKLAESSSNIFNNNFDIQLTCDDPSKQQKCNQLTKEYLTNPSEFDVHRFFQDLFQITINKMHFDGFQKSKSNMRSSKLL